VFAPEVRQDASTSVKGCTTANCNPDCKPGRCSCSPTALSTRTLFETVGLVVAAGWQLENDVLGRRQPEEPGTVDGLTASACGAGCPRLAVRILSPGTSL
jgi:hypothetical protein